MMPGESAVKGDRLVERGSKAAKCPGSGPSEWKLVVLLVVALAERVEAMTPEREVRGHEGWCRWKVWRQMMRPRRSWYLW